MLQFFGEYWLSILAMQEMSLDGQKIGDWPTDSSCLSLSVPLLPAAGSFVVLWRSTVQANSSPGRQRQLTLEQGFLSLASLMFGPDNSFGAGLEGGGMGGGLSCVLL